MSPVGGVGINLAIQDAVAAANILGPVLQKGTPALSDLAKVQAAILGHYAENDQFASPAAARDLEGKLKAAGKQVEFHIYPGTEHGFFNDTRPEAYHAEAAKLSWERTLAFYREHLG